MQQNNVIFATIGVAYLLFITLKGELPNYITLLRGGGPQASGNTGTANAANNPVVAGAQALLSGDMSSFLPALIQQESGGNPNAVSPTGALGLTQILPSTAADPGYGVSPLTEWTPQAETQFTTDYLNALQGVNGGDPRLALAAYNAGQGTVDNAGGNFNALPSGVQSYVNNIMNGTY